jgi:hypothetical protein
VDPPFVFFDNLAWSSPICQVLVTPGRAQRVDIMPS